MAKAKRTPGFRAPTPRAGAPGAYRPKNLTSEPKRGGSRANLTMQVTGYQETRAMNRAQGLTSEGHGDIYRQGRGYVVGVNGGTPNLETGGIRHEAIFNPKAKLDSTYVRDLTKPREKGVLGSKRKYQPVIKPAYPVPKTPGFAKRKPQTEGQKAMNRGAANVTRKATGPKRRPGSTGTGPRRRAT